MKEEIGAIQGILLGVVAGAAAWVAMLYFILR
jgi:hypothetical protein